MEENEEGEEAWIERNGAGKYRVRRKRTQQDYGCVYDEVFYSFRADNEYRWLKDRSLGTLFDSEEEAYFDYRVSLDADNWEKVRVL